MFPYIFIYFAVFISKTAFYREQSDIIFEEIAKEKRSFLVIVD